LKNVKKNWTHDELKHTSTTLLDKSCQGENRTKKHCTVDVNTITTLKYSAALVINSAFYSNRVI